MIVIFDLDGTVWDSAAGIVGSLAHTFQAFDLPVPSDEVLSSNLGPPLHRMLVELGIPEARVEEAVGHYRHRYAEWGAFQADPYPGMVELLIELNDAGHRLATATSKGEDPTRQMLDHFELRQHFEVIGAATMDDSATTKSQVLGRALAALGQPDPSECVMVGDRHFDVDGAAEHGIECIGVSWGYSAGTELVDAGAADVVHSPTELRSALLARGDTATPSPPRHAPLS